MKLFIPSFYTFLLQIVVYWYRQGLNSRSIIHPSETLLIKLIITDNYLIDWICLNGYIFFFSFFFNFYFILYIYPASNTRLSIMVDYLMIFLYSSIIGYFYFLSKQILLIKLLLFVFFTLKNLLFVSNLSFFLFSFFFFWSVISFNFWLQYI